MVELINSSSHIIARALIHSTDDDNLWVVVLNVANQVEWKKSRKTTEITNYIVFNLSTRLGHSFIKF